MKSGLKAWLVVCAIAGFGCTGADKTQVLTGRVTQQGAIAVRAIDGDTVITAGRVRSDGSFTLSLPAGHRYRLEVLTANGVHNIVGTKDGSLADLTFKVCQPQDPFDMGGFGEPCDPTDPNTMCEPGCDPTTDPNCWKCEPDDPMCQPTPCDQSDPNCTMCDPGDPNCGGGCDPTDPNCTKCDPMTDPTCGQPCDPNTDPMCPPPCDPNDPDCGKCDPMTDPNCGWPTPCDPATDPMCVPPCDPMTDPNCGTCDPATDPNCGGTCDLMNDPDCKCYPGDPNCDPWPCDPTTDPMCGGTCDPTLDAMCPVPPPPCDDPMDPNTCKDPCMDDPAACGCGVVEADKMQPTDGTCWPPPEPCNEMGCPDDPWAPENWPTDFGCEETMK